MVAFGDIGKNAKDLFNGNPKSGAFSYDSKLSFSSATASGVTFAVNAVSKDASTIGGTVKLSHSNKCYAADATLDPKGNVTLSASLNEALRSYVPGVKLGASCVLPNPSSAKLTADYAPCKEFATKVSCTLVSTPLVDASAAVVYKGVVLGGEAAYDTAKSVLSKYTVGAGYAAPDFQVAAHLLNKGSAISLSYCHVLAKGTSLGAEVTRQVSSGATTFTAGYARKLASGAVAKIKLDNTGLLSSMYETKLPNGEKLAGSLQVKATDLTAPFKYGFAVDLS
ncbi:hypothetical protein FOA52_004415 [Chlamydomonas sp. UWO 241]|nr:hypothetical protein FOA52_004415 [Chlamydomonas sp. UWO 241]